MFFILEIGRRKSIESRVKFQVMHLVKIMYLCFFCQHLDDQTTWKLQKLWTNTLILFCSVHGFTVVHSFIFSSTNLWWLWTNRLLRTLYIFYQQKCIKDEKLNHPKMLRAGKIRFLLPSSAVTYLKLCWRSELALFSWYSDKCSLIPR